MPALPGFSSNPFVTRSDLTHAALSILQPLEHYKSPLHARIKLATSTGAGFSETSSQLEGFARPLWIVADLLRLQALDPTCTQGYNVKLETWISGLKAGTDPVSPEYWGDLSPFDQRMVEMESIAYALLVAPEYFAFSSDPPARTNLVAWLRQINDHAMPKSNWLWFRVLVNLALTRSLGVPLAEVKNYIDESLATLDTFYMDHGWSSDGLWCEERKQADYYSGSFAIQFAQLLFVKFAPDYDESRTELYRSRAVLFAQGFWRYFDTNGAAIPFGRSLTYRFAFAAFWSAVSLIDDKIQLAEPLIPGTEKGLLMRHLRWWAKQPHIFNTDGTPNIGYTYPNMYLAEDYTSPQSPLWCLKSFLVLGLPETSTFWAEEECAHPLQLANGKKIERLEWLPAPRHLMCNTASHHFLLSSGQSTSKKFKARDSKYGKFAYSSHFGFSVPTGNWLEQQAPDSTLAVCIAGEEDAWKVRWDPSDVSMDIVEVSGTRARVLKSCWRPWTVGRGVDVVVETRLIMPESRWEGWYVRIHKVVVRGERIPKLRFVDSGFAASAQTKEDVSLFERDVGSSFDANRSEAMEGWWNEGKATLIISESGASGVVDLTKEFGIGGQNGVETRTKIIRADPNTNLMTQRSLIPCVEHVVDFDTLDAKAKVDERSFWMATGVFAIAGSAKEYMDKVGDLWHDKPIGKWI
ncbi:hypothetical protein B0J11DRAFT_597731 [Dendryphion nanum]|uniref:DUF2264 domain protein n=1 Tax=Dendryphion nanum TaxID=256645 RepID=A0A9P9D5T0_9PLEO|nr:hypothetical protein B0J11DRAFT_597731 [Dendryphion nanum]